MTRNIVTATKDMSTKQAALTMVEKGIGSLPVLEDEKLIGIVTRDDLLRHCAGLHDN